MIIADIDDQDFFTKLDQIIHNPNLIGIHISIKDGKIWIERDFTEEGIPHQLVELGVPKSDIVLGFRSPYVRQFTGFASV